MQNKASALLGSISTMDFPFSCPFQGDRLGCLGDTYTCIHLSGQVVIRWLTVVHCVMHMSAKAHKLLCEQLDVLAKGPRPKVMAVAATDKSLYADEAVRI